LLPCSILDNKKIARIATYHILIISSENTVPEQVNPSPKNPALQVHKKEPMVSAHCALGSQGLLPAHSLISKTRRGFFVQMMLGCDINATFPVWILISFFTKVKNITSLVLCSQ
jgi:hypothetical protein